MPVLQSPPYDSLATVTSLTRTVLADYIQNLQPNYSGTLTVGGGGFSITWASGNQFTYLMNGVAILINGVPNVINQVTSPTTGTLLNQAAIGAGVAYSLTLPLGDIFSDSQAYVLPTINLAWRKLQKKLDIASHPRMRNQVILQNIPAVTSQDPSSQQWINWSNFFDGTNLLNAPVLPADFIAPMRLYERQAVGAGNTNTFGFVEMHPVTDGIPALAKSSRNGVWDWREDALYLPGSTLSQDWRITYQAFLPDIAVSGSFATTAIPIMRCAESLAFYSASLFVDPRGGSAQAMSWDNKGDQATDALTNRQSKVLQRGSYRRRAVYVSMPQYRYR